MRQGFLEHWITKNGPEALEVPVTLAPFSSAGMDSAFLEGDEKFRCGLHFSSRIFDLRV